MRFIARFALWIRRFRNKPLPSLPHPRIIALIRERFGTEMAKKTYYPDSFQDMMR